MMKATNVAGKADKLAKKASSKSRSQKKPNSAAKGLVATDGARKDKAWNDMSHMSIKRFPDGDPILRPGALRNRATFPYVALAELDPSGRASCKLCGSSMEKGALRMGLMMECHAGYRSLCTLHTECFWEHPETKKLQWDDIFVRPNVDHAEKEMLKQEFDAFSDKKTNI